MHMVPRRYEGVDETLGIGAAAGDAIGYGAKVAGRVGMTVGSLGMGAAIGVAGLTGKAAIAAVPTAVRLVGQAGLGTASFLTRDFGPFASPLKTAVKLTGKIGKNMVKYEGSHLQYNRYLGKLERKGPSLSLSKFGVGVVGGLAAVQGLRGAYNSYMTSRMGTVDTKVTSLTPDYSPQEYSARHPDFAGATGDLVFALHTNRRG